MWGRGKGGIAPQSTSDNGTLPIPTTVAWRVPNRPGVTCMLRTPQGAHVHTHSHTHTYSHTQSLRVPGYISTAAGPIVCCQRSQTSLKFNLICCKPTCHAFRWQPKAPLSDNGVTPANNSLSGNRPGRAFCGTGGSDAGEGR